MGFCIVERLNGDLRHASLGREALGIAAGLAAHKERDFVQLLFGVRSPGERVLRLGRWYLDFVASLRFTRGLPMRVDLNRLRRGGSSDGEMRGRGAVPKFGVLAEHRK